MLRRGEERWFGGSWVLVFSSGRRQCGLLPLQFPDACVRPVYYPCLRPGVVRVGQVSLSFCTPSSSTILGIIQETNHQLIKGLRLENVTWIDGEGKGQIAAGDGKEIQSPSCSFLAHEVIAPTTRVFVRSKRDSMCKRVTVLST